MTFTEAAITKAVLSWIGSSHGKKVMLGSPFVSTTLGFSVEVLVFPPFFVWEFETYFRSLNVVKLRPTFSS